MVCPKCGSTNIQVVSEQQTVGSFKDNTRTKGFGGCKACIGTIILGPIGFFCGLCGMGKKKGKVVDNRKVKTNIVYCCMNCGHRFK